MALSSCFVFLLRMWLGGEEERWSDLMGALLGFSGFAGIF